MWKWASRDASRVSVVLLCMNSACRFVYLSGHPRFVVCLHLMECDDPKEYKSRMIIQLFQGFPQFPPED